MVPARGLHGSSLVSNHCSSSGWSPQDEVQERSGLTDFLLTKMRDVLLSVSTVKLILCSAALDVDLFRRYFASCSLLRSRSSSLTGLLTRLRGTQG